MKMTILYDLRDQDWTDEVKLGIEEWILEPRDLLLTIAFKGEKLKAVPDFPTWPVYDLTYFLRRPDHVFKVDTFHDEIMFGTFVDSVESNMLQVLEHVYAPYFFAINTWPDSEYLLSIRCTSKSFIFFLVTRCMLNKINELRQIKDLKIFF